MKLNLDFTGRFVFVEHGNGDLTVLAVNLPPSIEGDRHEPLLIVSESKEPLPITGCKVDIPIRGSFTWNESGPALADLGTLSGGGVLNKTYLDSIPAGSRTTAIIHLHAGEGLRRSDANKLKYEYVYGNGRKSSFPVQQLADAVAVTIKDDSPQVLLSLTSNGGDSRTIPVSGSEVTLKLRNMCSKRQIPGKDPDLRDHEFVGYYDILLQPPPQANRPIPKVQAPVAGLFPFGDCYLSAKISA